jgi:hypothetical protein
MATLSPRDATAWHALCLRIAARTDSDLGSEVLANRTVGPGRIEPLARSIRQARWNAGRLSASAGLLIRTDVCAFYPSVTPPVLARTLAAAGAEPADAAAAADMLEGWGSEGYAGLPVGPPGSALLANAVLAPADRALDRFGFLRWVDDYLIAVPSERVAEEALDSLDAALEPLLLVRSPSKTALHERGPTPWLTGEPSGLGAPHTPSDASAARVQTRLAIGV